MGIGRKEKKGDVVPGPGQYSTLDNPRIVASPKYGFGSSERKDLKNLDAPGPGAYNGSQYDPKPPAGRQISFGKALRSTEKKSDGPGPG